MSAALVLPMVWATAAPLPEALQVGEQRLVVRGRTFYRSYTETILRRYSKMSMEAGRVSSLLGRELFRGDVTSYKVHSFDDVVIFVHDVEKCLAKLDNGQQQLIERIAIQEYSQGEAAEMMGLSLRSVLRRYGEALDRLTQLLLEAGLLYSMKSCQVVEPCGNLATDCLQSFY
jgi:DNA-directed RNA polymerase specialized sigma24 family protein